MDAFVDVAQEAICWKWRSLFEACSPLLLLRKDLAGVHAVTPWRHSKVPGFYGMLQLTCLRLKRPVLSHSSFVVVLASLMLLTYSPILHEIVHVIFLCACMKSSIESSRYLASIVADRGSMTRPELQAVVLQSLGSLCLNAVLPRRVSESLGAAEFLLRVARATRRLGLSDVAHRLLEMGNSLRSYVSAPGSSYASFAEDACVLVTSGQPLRWERLDEEEAVPPIEHTAAFFDAPSECPDAEEEDGAVVLEVSPEDGDRGPADASGLGPTAAPPVSPPVNELRLSWQARSLHRESILTLEEFLE